jgi:hypothetical protein
MLNSHRNSCTHCIFVFRYRIYMPVSSLSMFDRMWQSIDLDMVNREHVHVSCARAVTERSDVRALTQSCGAGGRCASGARAYRFFYYWIIAESKKGRIS